MAKRSSNSSSPATASKAAAKPKSRVLDARPDTLDFRDKMYVPTLVEVPTRIDLQQYIAQRVPILDQGDSSSCRAAKGITGGVRDGCAALFTSGADR